MQVNTYIGLVCQEKFFESSVEKQVYAYECMQLSQGWAKDPCCVAVFIVFCVWTHAYVFMSFLCVNVWVSECMDVELEVFECMAGLERRQCYIAPCIWMLRIWHMTCIREWPSLWYFEFVWTSDCMSVGQSEHMTIVILIVIDECMAWKRVRIWVLSVLTKTCILYVTKCMVLDIWVYGHLSVCIWVRIWVRAYDYECMAGLAWRRASGPLLSKNLATAPLTPQRQL